MLDDASQIVKDLFESRIKNKPNEAGIVTLKDNWFKTYICTEYPSLNERIEITYHPLTGNYEITKYQDDELIFEANIKRRKWMGERASDDSLVRTIYDAISYTETKEESSYAEATDENKELDSESSSAKATDENEEIVEDIVEDSPEIYNNGGKMKYKK